ncbi:Hypothetical predicted protein [Prunus dulcis]|uniref:Uncharacterized protein n=1 Tax=Prunus dulcis TaxID=3755 RepID=A0A5E4EU59_PRUDU|nr:Hypothetical predicted protein [Prunus dulcis]
MIFPEVGFSDKAPHSHFEHKGGMGLGLEAKAWGWNGYGAGDREWGWNGSGAGDGEWVWEWRVVVMGNGRRRKTRRKSGVGWVWGMKNTEGGGGGRRSVGVEDGSVSRVRISRGERKLGQDTS